MTPAFVSIGGFKQATHRPGNHQFFIRANDTNHNSAAFLGNHRPILPIARLVQVNAEKLQSVTDAGTDDG